MSASFGDRLAKAMAERGPLCVGIDPHPNLLEQWGLEDSAEGLAAFTEAVYEGCAPFAAALKPQVALFERHGSAGLAVLEALFARAAADGVLIVADAKRGDIGSTMTLNRMVYEEENPAKVKEQDLYQNLIYYIEEHLEEELSLEKLAGAFFVSRYYVAHVFKEQAGISVHQYILKKRMQASREAILGGENISQVYERFGFRDYSSFYRAFRREYGMSPKEYREERLR